MKDLTLRQQEILGFIQLHQREQGYWPSIRDIQTHFKFASTNAVMGHLRALEHKGAISRVLGQARSFRVTHDPDSTPPDHSFDVVDIPVYGNIAAGYPDGVEPGGEIGRLQIDVHTAGIRRARQNFALKVRGDSMIDAAINDGDIVIFERAPAKDGDIVAALIDGETTLKRFISKPGRLPFLKAENAHYPDLHPVADLVIQGIAKAVVRSL
jgi:repressor LexA